MPMLFNRFKEVSLSTKTPLF
jgi:hypothetical protein